MVNLRRYAGAFVGAASVAGLIYGTARFCGVDLFCLEETREIKALGTMGTALFGLYIFGPIIWGGAVIGDSWQRHNEIYRSNKLQNNREP